MTHEENPSVKDMIKEREKIQATVSNVILKDGKYVGHIHGKQITVQTTHEKALIKMAKFVKGQK